MGLNEILAGGGVGLVAVLTLIQIAPIKVNPWSALARALGRAFNGEVLKRLNKLEKSLEDHIRVDDERNADSYRRRILQFNTDLIMETPLHTREDFIDVLAVIDSYEHYCDTHKEYKNSRCVHAIANIRREYDEHLKEHDFMSF